MQQATERLISQLTVTVQITEALFAQISSLKGCVADSESGIFLKQSMYLAARLVEEKGASEDAQQTIRKLEEEIESRDSEIQDLKVTNHASTLSADLHSHLFDCRVLWRKRTAG